jgi:hypothetical protein
LTSTAATVVVAASVVVVLGARVVVAATVVVGVSVVVQSGELVVTAMVVGEVVEAVPPLEHDATAHNSATLVKARLIPNRGMSRCP